MLQMIRYDSNFMICEGYKLSKWPSVYLKVQKNDSNIMDKYKVTNSTSDNSKLLYTNIYP